VGIFAQCGMWRYSHVKRCGDFLTKLGVVMARRTIEVRKPRDIGDAIRAVREARGISQEDLAQANAYDRFYLYRLEAGRSTVYITRLLRTLKSLGITLSVTFDTGDPAAGDGR
jgi:ribosome-binding protein aMBF1 (putative translation factor)